jgi:hypothetical protein
MPEVVIDGTGDNLYVNAKPFSYPIHCHAAANRAVRKKSRQRLQNKLFQHDCHGLRK